jgi:hypothetical protein
MTGGTITVENLTYTQIKKMMIQRWEFMKALRLNKKGNKSKEKIVEEKKESGMKTVLNAFERGDRERGVRGRGGRERGVRGKGKRGERERGTRVDSTQTPNTTQSKLQPPPTTT